MYDDLGAVDPGGEVISRRAEGIDPDALALGPQSVGNKAVPASLGDDQTGESGMGIGLTMSRSYVEQMGGTLELESTVGEGTTAVMTLPVSLAV